MLPEFTEEQVRHRGGFIGEHHTHHVTARTIDRLSPTGAGIVAFPCVVGRPHAGGSRVTRWSATLLSGKPVTDSDFDVELFVERIPYLETRGYVRNITVNEAMYRLLYN